MERGYLALYRKIQDHPFYKERREFSKLEAWIDILMEVQHSEEPCDVVIGMKVLVCNYGESLKSVLTWARRWNWNDSKVRRYFKLLEKLDQISIKNEVVTTRITVLNYSIYDPKRSSNDFKVTSIRRAFDEHSTTDKHDKHYNIKEIYSDKLREFVSQYIKFISEEKGNKAPKSSSLEKQSLDTVDKLIRLDGFELDEIRKILKWAFNDSFWSDNVLSLASLRIKKSGLTKFQKIKSAYDRNRPDRNTEKEKFLAELE